MGGCVIQAAATEGRGCCDRRCCVCVLQVGCHKRNEMGTSVCDVGACVVCVSILCRPVLDRRMWRSSTGAASHLWWPTDGARRLELLSCRLPVCQSVWLAGAPHHCCRASIIGLTHPGIAPPSVEIWRYKGKQQLPPHAPCRLRLNINTRPPPQRQSKGAASARKARELQARASSSPAATAIVNNLQSSTAPHSAGPQCWGRWKECDAQPHKATSHQKNATPLP